MAIVDDSLLSGNKFNLIQSISINAEGIPKPSVLGVVPYSRGQLRSAKEEIVATLIHVKQEFDRQNIFVPCLVMDDGKTNPSALQLRALGLYILPCVAHVQCNSIQRVVKVNTMTYNGGIINVAKLKALFTVRNALNDDEKLYVGIFWKHLQKYGKLSRYAKLAALRNSGNSDYYTQSKFFLLNCAWRGRIIQHLPQLDTYFTLLVNVQRVQQLLEMRMTVENANELTRFILFPKRVNRVCCILTSGSLIVVVN